jgi:hypothetical protein
MDFYIRINQKSENPEHINYNVVQDQPRYYLQMDIWNFTQDDIMAARSIWKGAISFGLVNIPIQVFSAEQKEEYTSFTNFSAVHGLHQR